MNCPFCKRKIEAMTGFQEINKFQKHLVNCKKNPKRKVFPAFVDESGFLESSANLTPLPTLNEALKLRAGSGQ